jgi:alanyl aminopeptidase
MTRGAVLVMLAACASPEPVRPVTPVAREALVAPKSAPRLPRDFRPVGYRVQLQVGEGLAGHVEITGDLTTPTGLIWLDGDQLRVSSARAIRGAQAIDLDVTRTVWPRRPTEVLALRTHTPLAAGRWTLVLDYTAPIASQPITDNYARVASATEHVFREVSDGKSYVFTNFEPMGARRAFPCVDEPDIKVPWQLTLDIDADAIAASNTPIVHEVTLANGRKRVEFAPTPPLPSYLVAFAVGPFEIVPAAASQRGVPIRILVPRGQPAQARAAATAGRALDLEEAWFTTPCRPRASTGPRWRIPGSSPIAPASFTIATRGPRRYFTSSRISGSATWSRPHGGATSG